MARVETNLENSCGEAVKEIGEALVADVKSHWAAQHRAYDYGNPPAKKTENLDSSIFVDSTGRDTSGRFSADAKVIFVRFDTSLGDDPQGRGNYTQALEDMSYIYKRPFTAPAIARMEAKFEAMFRRIVKP